VVKKEGRIYQQQKKEEANGQKYLAPEYLPVFPQSVAIPNFPTSSENCDCHREQHEEPERKR
jgi:hypothetical protein